jgi:hypothetical protein
MSFVGTVSKEALKSLDPHKLSVGMMMCKMFIDNRKS